jgi:hypothetical protein
MKKIILFFLVLMTQQIHSQEVYFNVGKNYTDYKYKNSQGSAVAIFDKKNKSSFEQGSSYEAGYSFNGEKHRLSYMLGLTFNEFNGKYFTSGTSDAYTWKTQYVGIQNVVNYAFFRSKRGLEFGIRGGFNVAGFLRGEQYSNGLYYDISNQSDFRGVVVQSIVGVNVKYKISSACALSLGYNLSTVISAVNFTDEDLGFTNNQIQFGIHLPINKKKK